MQELIVQWTHDSTAIEGNTLTLGETKAVIEHGLTISGKPLKDHREVIGHKRALDLVFTWSGRRALSFDDLFDLHRAVLKEANFDIMQPIGACKVEKNRVRVKTRDGRIAYIEFADPAPGIDVDGVLAESAQPLVGRPAGRCKLGVERLR